MFIHLFTLISEGAQLALRVKLQMVSGSNELGVILVKNDTDI